MRLRSSLKQLFAIGIATLVLHLQAAAAVPPTGLGDPGAHGSGPFTLSIAPLGSQIRWTKGRAIVTSVTVGGVAATNLHVNVVLTDEVTARQFGDADFIACSASGGNCTPIASLPANATQRLFLRPRLSAEPLPGKYSGTIQLIADQGKSDAASFTIDVTSGFYIALGIFTVALGTLLSLAFTVGVRNRMVRLQMLQAIGAVQDRLGVVEQQLAACGLKPGPTPVTSRSISIAHRAVSVETLDRASLLPTLWSINPAGFVTSAAFKDRVDQTAAWTVVLGHIVNLGFAQIGHLNATKPGVGPAITLAVVQTNDFAILAAWGQIDALATNKSGAIEPAPDLAAVDAQIIAAINAAQNVVGRIGGAPSRTINTEQLNKQVNILGFTNWVVAALLTTLVGSYVLVLSHNDFGRLNDIWLCLFWGLGLPTATQLSQATPSTLAGSVGITLPK